MHLNLKLNLNPTLFSNIFDSIKDLISIVDLDFTFINFNKAYSVEFEKIFGRKVEIGKSVPQLLSHLPLDLKNATTSWAKALSGEKYTVYLEFGDENLERKFYEIEYSPLLDEKGKVYGAFQIARDCTIEGKLKKAETEKLESETRFRLLAEGATDIISTHLIDSTIVYISPSAEKILGYRLEELIGKKAYDYYHPDDLKEMQNNYQEIVEIPDSHTVIFRFKKKDGSYVWFESIGKTIRDVQGNPVEVQAINRDITERKKAEQLAKDKEDLLAGVLNTSLSGLQVFKSIRDSNGKIIDFEWILVNDSILKKLA